jgi:hypothetical protein
MSQNNQMVFMNQYNQMVYMNLHNQKVYMNQHNAMIYMNQHNQMVYMNEHNQISIFKLARGTRFWNNLQFTIYWLECMLFASVSCYTHSDKSCMVKRSH